MAEPSQAQLDAGFAFVREKANSVGPMGRMAPDDKLMEFVKEFAEVILSAPGPDAPK